MRILFMTRWYPTKENPVLGVFVKDFAKVASMTNQVVVLNGYQGNSVRDLYEISEEVEEIRAVRVRHRKIVSGKLSYLLYFYATIRAFQKIRNEFKPEIIHAHVFLSGVIGVILGKLYRIPVIISEHVFIEKSIESLSLSQKLIDVMRRLLARLALNKAQLVIVPSDFMSEYLISMGIKNKIKVIPNIVDTNLFYPSHSNDKMDYKKILFVGGLHPVKGISYLLHALRKLEEKRSDFFLDIVGDGAPYRNEYEQQAKDLGIADKVKFHGRKSKEEVAEFMRKCDFLVLPSVWEAFGIVLIEAMACGKPVIATACGQKEIIKENNGILVPPKDVQALAQAVEYILDHYQKYSSEDISQYVRDKFSYEAVGKILHETYVQVLKEYQKQ